MEDLWTILSLCDEPDEIMMKKSEKYISCQIKPCMTLNKKLPKSGNFVCSF